MVLKIINTRIFLPCPNAVFSLQSPFARSKMYRAHYLMYYSINIRTNDTVFPLLVEVHPIPVRSSLHRLVFEFCWYSKTSKIDDVEIFMTFCLFFYFNFQLYPLNLFGRFLVFRVQAFMLRKCETECRCAGKTENGGDLRSYFIRNGIVLKN